MTPELTALTLAAIFQAIQFGLMSISANLDVGPGKTMSPRDMSRMGKPLAEQLSDKPARLHRAYTNHFEGLILFTIAVVVVTFAEQSTPLTAVCAYTYLAARIAYVPAYYFGWTPWRSLIWLVGFLATTLMLLSSLF